MRREVFKGFKSNLEYANAFKHMFIRHQMLPWPDNMMLHFLRHCVAQVKVAAIIAGIALLSSSSTFLPAQVGKFAHLVAFGLWLGTNVWVSVGGVIMFK